MKVPGTVARAVFTWQVPLIVICWLLCAWAPWLSSGSRTTWLVTAVFFSSHGLHTLEASSRFVTATVACIAVAGALLMLAQAYAGQGRVALRQAGLFSVCLPLSVLMPVEGAVMYLVTVTIIVSLGWFFRNSTAYADTHEAFSRTIVRESFPVLAAICFLTMGWQYNAQLLMRGLLISAGLALIGSAFLPLSHDRAIQS